MATGKYAYLPEEMREFYVALKPEKIKIFVDYRGQGFTLEKSWVLSGHSEKQAKANASAYLKNHPQVQELIKQIQTHNRLMQLNDPNSPLCKEIMNNQEKAKTALEIAHDRVGEDASEIMFYVNVQNGNLKSTEKTTIKDADGNVVNVKIVEREPTIADRMKAREKLSEILGMSSIRNQSVQTEEPEDIQITIIDPSNKELLKEQEIDLESGEIHDDNDVDD